MQIADTFDITGRGLVIVVDQTTSLPVGKKLSAKITRLDGSVVMADAYKERILRRNPESLEKEGFLLMGLSKSDVPIGSSLQIALPET